MSRNVEFLTGVPLERVREISENRNIEKVGYNFVGISTSSKVKKTTFVETLEAVVHERLQLWCLC
jgi:hypothetical protein